MNNFHEFLDRKEYTTFISVINLVCEMTEKSKAKDKHVYAMNAFKLVVAELKAHNKISDQLYEQCKSISADQLGSAIKDTIAMWNKVVPLYKRAKRLLKMCRK